MSFKRTYTVPNGETFSNITVYSCDITGEEIDESWGYYGNGNRNIHISENGMEVLIEQWIKRNAHPFMYPSIIYYLIERLCKRIKPDRYLPKSLKEQVLLKYKHQCVHCGATENLSIDHIKPVSKKGLNEFKNLQVLCKSCNSRKGNKYE